jgi:hypothetical protein
MIIFKINSDPDDKDTSMWLTGYHNRDEVISVLSLSARYHKCPSFAALTRDICDVVPQAIKLISPRPSYDNLSVYIYNNCPSFAALTRDIYDIVP